MYIFIAPQQAKRNNNRGVTNLCNYIYILIVISNNNVLQIVPDKNPVSDTFLIRDDISRQSILCMIKIISQRGLININFVVFLNVSPFSNTMQHLIGPHF